MPVTVTRLAPDSAPSTVGTVVVREHPPGRREVRFVASDGPRIVYSSELAVGDDLQRVIDWAVEWAARRNLDRIYVEAEPPPGARATGLT